MVPDSELLSYGRLNGVRAMLLVMNVCVGWGEIGRESRAQEDEPEIETVGGTFLPWNEIKSIELS